MWFAMSCNLLVISCSSPRTEVTKPCIRFSERFHLGINETFSCAKDKMHLGCVVSILIWFKEINTCLSEMATLKHSPEGNEKSDEMCVCV